ncbi:hypothetical protein GCM10010976_25640 [Bizionia arctica]|uniref:non-specific serine/threonine protein kinase n=1 Tax=Bizionia arctica TaxID=1495645 RepID=A0A917GPK8_9FLAO|nr:hypothetical protein GCM10010976_25640 [Bizionia arctica]
MPTSERDALIAFYNATDGPNWNPYMFENWNTSNPVSTWSGITVTNISGTDHVTEFDLMQTTNTVTGVIPPEIGDLTYLTILKINRKDLYGSIPSEIGNLTNLVEIELNHNRLSGSIPSEIGNLNNLEWLLLWDNQLTGSIPVSLANCTNLNSLSLEENQLSGEIPAEFSNLINMEQFWINDNNLSGSVSGIFDSWENLGTFGIYNNQLTGNLDLSSSIDIVWILAEDNLLENIKIKNGNNSFQATFNAFNNPNLVCIEVDNASDAINGLAPYDSGWYVDNVNIYSEDCGSLSTEEFVTNSLKIYPNPVSDILYLENSNNQIKEFWIFDALGNQVFSSTIVNRKHKIDFSSFSSGVYFLKAKDTENAIVIKKIIK